MRQDVSVSFAPPRDTGFPPSTHPIVAAVEHAVFGGCGWACDPELLRPEGSAVHTRLAPLPRPPALARFFAAQSAGTHTRRLRCRGRSGNLTLSRHPRSSLLTSLTVSSSSARACSPRYVRAWALILPSWAMGQAASAVQCSDRAADDPRSTSPPSSRTTLPMSRSMAGRLSWPSGIPLVRRTSE